MQLFVYQSRLQLDIDGYRETAEDLLFNSRLPGVLGYTKGSFTLDGDSSESEVMMTAMGQGRDDGQSVSDCPDHSGNRKRRHSYGALSCDSVTNYTGAEVRRNVPKSSGRLMTADEAVTLKDYMSAVVSDGTGSSLSGRSYTVAGKTGTAQYSTSESERSHSWFTGFTNVDYSELVITVVTEGSDGSAGRAGLYDRRRNP